MSSVNTYEVPIIVAPNKERPAHGYELGQLLFDAKDFMIYQLATKNPHRWQAIRGATKLKEGSSTFSGSTVKGEGLLQDMAALGGTPGVNNLDSNGSWQQFSTGAVTIQNAGVAVLRPVANDFQGFMRNDYLPYYAAKSTVNAKTSGDYRHYQGWIKNSTGPAIGETPLLNTEGGIIVGFNAADTNWSVWHSNGDGVTAVSKSQFTSVATPAALTRQTIEMFYLTATSIQINIYNSSNTLSESKTISTNVLPSGKPINWVNVVQNPNTTNKTLICYALEMRSLL